MTVMRPPVSAAMRVTIAGESIDLLPHRAAYWSSARTLLIADLHLGKADALRGMGAALPVAAILESQLAQLDAALGAAEGCDRILILGDLLHAPIGITADMVARVAQWRAGRHALRLELVPGNHDRQLERVAGQWRMEVLEERHREGPFDFVHVPREGAGAYTWSGHLHPAITLRRGCDSLRLPCFQVGERAAVLPAFSRFTAGGPFVRGAADRVFAIAEASVVEV